MKDCKQDGHCLNRCEVCEACLEFDKQWSSCAGELSGVRRGIKLLEDEATAAFLSMKDDLANRLRRMATHLREQETELDKKLQEFINIQEFINKRK